MADQSVNIDTLVRGIANLNTLDIQIGGDDQATWTAPSGEQGMSFNHAIRLVVENGLLGARPFSTYAKMIAPDVDPPLSDGDYAIVANDPVLSKNGNYQKVGEDFVWIKYNPVSSRTISANGVSFAITDAENNQTWLQANSQDGGLTGVSEQAIRDRLNVLVKDNSLSLFAVTDVNGNLTELQLDSKGEVPLDVLQEWNSRLGNDNKTPADEASTKINIPITLPELVATQTGIKSSDTYHKNGELLPILPDNDFAIIIGSSSADRSKVFIETALKNINPNIRVFVPAFGGAITEQQAAMVGNKPLRVEVVGGKINASGNTDLNLISDINVVSKLLNLPVWLYGISGRINVASNQLYFARKTDAAADTLIDKEIDVVPSSGHTYRNAMQILWVGKNNLTSSNEAINDVESLLDKTDDMLIFNASLIKRSVIMTHFVNTNTAADDPVRQRINYCNHLYKLRYKQNVFDVEPILLGTQIFTDLGITRTSTDIAQQDLGNLPPSLAAVDGGHCLPIVYEYLAQKLGEFIATKNLLGV